MCAKAAAVAVSVGSVTVSSGVPGPASSSMPVCRSTASTSSAVSKPSCAPVRAAGAVPARRHPARRRRHRAPLQQPVPVRDVVAHLGRRQHQRDGGRQPGPLAPRDRGGPHGTQRAGARLAALRGGAFGLSLRQDRDDQAVIVRDDPGELSVIGPKCQTESAEMGHPLGPEPVRQSVDAGPDYSEHDDPPGVVQLCAALWRGRAVHRTERPVHPYVPHVTRTARSIIFSFFRALKQEEP